MQHLSARRLLRLDRAAGGRMTKDHARRLVVELNHWLRHGEDRPVKPDIREFKTPEWHYSHEGD